MITLPKPTWTDVLDKQKNCIMVRRQGKSHVRRYRHNVKGGMARYVAELMCHYDSFPTFYPEKFYRKESGDV